MNEEQLKIINELVKKGKLGYPFETAAISATSFEGFLINLKNQFAYKINELNNEVFEAEQNVFSLENRVSILENDLKEKDSLRDLLKELYIDLNPDNYLDKERIVNALKSLNPKTAEFV